MIQLIAVSYQRELNIVHVFIEMLTSELIALRGNSIFRADVCCLFKATGARYAKIAFRLGRAVACFDLKWICTKMKRGGADLIQATGSNHEGCRKLVTTRCGTAW